MKFEKVLPALREGKKIRLKGCEEFKYLFKPENENELKTEDYHNINLSWKDFFSDDWEIVKETKKVRLRDLTADQFYSWKKRICEKGLDCEDCPFLSAPCTPIEDAWVNCKSLYGDKFLDQEIEIEEEE